MRISKSKLISALSLVGGIALSMSGVRAATTYMSAKLPATTDTLTILRLDNSTHALAMRLDSPVPKIVVYDWANGNFSDPGFLPGTVPGSGTIVSTATAFNDSLQIAGYAQTADANGEFASSHKRAFFYGDGTFVDLSQVPPFRASGGSPAEDQSAALGINNQGDFVGYWTNGGNTGQHAFLRKQGTTFEIGAPIDPEGQPGNTPIENAATAINNLGQVTGYSKGTNLGTEDRLQPFLYSDGVSTAIGTLPGIGVDINDQTVILGRANDEGTVGHCFIYSNGQTKVLPALNVAAGVDCKPHKLNSAGVAVGRVSTSDVPHNPLADGPFVYSEGTIKNLNSLISPSDALVRNNITLDDAVTINDKGEIIATAGHDYYLLTPTTTSDAADYNFETDTQGWQSNADPIIDVSTSTEQKFAGDRSLALKFNGSNGFARVSVSTPPVQAGQTITFHIYLPAGAPIDWIQPFAQEGAAGGWNWHGNWQPVEALQLGAWNTITVSVPADAQPINAIGVEIQLVQAYDGTVYVDSVDF